MPTYEYACTKCGHQFEAFQSFSDAALTQCPECQGEVQKVYSNVGVVSRVLVSIKLIQELLSHQQLQRHQHRPQHQKMISRGVVDDRLQFQHHVLNHRLRADQFHLASLLAKFSDRSLFAHS